MEKKTMISGITAILFVLVIVIAGIVILNKNSQVDMLSLQNANLNETIELRDSMVNEMASTFEEIEENLTFVRNKKDLLVITPQEGQENQKEMLVADIKLMNEMLEESSKKIDELDKKLKKSGLEIKSFRNKIAQLNKYIAEQDNSMQQLRAEIDQRDYKITEMDAQLALLQGDIASKEDSLLSKSQTIAVKSQTIVEKENEINKAYLAVGTHNQLIKNGVLSKEGGFLGIGKNTSISGDLNENYFTQLDIRNASHFPINTKKAKLISEHPANSYRLVEENDKVAYLEIENPQEFWKLTKYVVVETKN
jgi:peptidoglycan hydrolase CwlO-like protein